LRGVLALPPYALVPPAFRFRPLVALAERLPLGGDRETVLATFVTARVLWDWKGVDALETPFTGPRAQAVRQWLQGLSLPQSTRAVFQQLTDAVVRDDVASAIVAWERVLAAAARLIDGAARAEFNALSARLRGEAGA
jgi:hypothetical protein